jgi:hypothetical protein
MYHVVATLPFEVVPSYKPSLRTLFLNESKHLRSDYSRLTLQNACGGARLGNV